MMRRTMAFLIALASTAVIPLAAATTTTPAQADDCVGTWSIGIGGLGNNDSSVFFDVDQRVGYNTLDPMSGLNELGNLVWNHRNQCPDDHIKLIGHSEGAGILHAWVTNNQDFGNANAILLADPKRDAGPGWAGLSSTPGSGIIGYPLAGVDDWFGGFPVVTICNHDDMICNTEAGWFGYFTGAHSRYNFDVWSYGDWDSGVWFQ